MLALRSVRLVSRRPPLPGRRFKFSLPALPYDYTALEPVISAEIMEIHHSRHHQAFVDNLNVLGPRLEEAVAREDMTAVIQMQQDIKFNGGGHTNHSIWWTLLSPGGSGEPEGELAAAIVRDFGSLATLKAALSASAVGVQGSGWCWLGYDRGRGRMEVRTCANQDPLEATTGLIPLFGIDVWEHAYYLQYKNVRPDYVHAIFQVANWDNVAERLAEAKK